MNMDQSSIANANNNRASASGQQPPRPQRARTGFREDHPTINLQNVASVPSQHLLQAQYAQTHNANAASVTVPNPLLSSPFAHNLPTDEAQIRLQIAIAAQLSRQGVAAPNKTPMMVASTGNNESVAVVAASSTTSAPAAPPAAAAAPAGSAAGIIDHIPPALLEPVPFAPGHQHGQETNDQQDNAGSGNDLNEWDEIGALLNGETPMQQPRAKVSSASTCSDQQQHQQQAAGDSIKEQQASASISTNNMLPMLPLFSTTPVNVHAAIKSPPAPAANVISPPPLSVESSSAATSTDTSNNQDVGKAQAQPRQEVDMNSHASMLASAMHSMGNAAAAAAATKQDGRDIIDGTLLNRSSPVRVNPMWLSKIVMKKPAAAAPTTNTTTTRPSNTNKATKRSTTSSIRKKDSTTKRKKAVKIISKSLDVIEKEDHDAQSPQAFFEDLLRNRGYSTKAFPSVECGYHPPPTPLQLASFGTAVIKAVESDNAEQLESLLKSGLSPNPCNTFSDYILCRSIKRGCVNSFHVQVEAGADLRIADDFGRTTLHHAAWAASPNFDIVDAILDADKNMLRLSDRLGRTPLDYIHGSHRAEWTEYLKKIADKYWPDQGKDRTEEDVPPMVVREDGIIPDPAGALPAKQASLVAMGKVAPTTTANTKESHCDMSQGLKDMTLKGAATGSKRKVDDANLSEARQNFVQAKKLARRAPSSRKKVVASRCA